MHRCQAQTFNSSGISRQMVLVVKHMKYFRTICPIKKMHFIIIIIMILGFGIKMYSSFHFGVVLLNTKAKPC